MKDLAVRLAALDPDAGAALRVIAYFDRLAEGRAGLQTIVRGAAVLAGCPARLTDDARRIQLRVQPDGTDATAGPPDPSWMSVGVADQAVLWLERPGPPGPVDAMVLERAAGAARAVLERTRRQIPPADPASVELTLDAAAPEHLRLTAAARLGLKPSDQVRAIAYAGAPPALLAAGNRRIGHPVETDTGRMTSVGPLQHAAGRPGGTTAADNGLDATITVQRAGIGPAGPVADLPTSYTAARIALRFTATGTEADPGPTVVHADRLGGLALLAATVGPGTEPIPDVRALDRVAACAPWALATLDAVAETLSLRAAATQLRVHHSTLQERLTHAAPLLGWDIREPQGRLRLQVALALRRLHRNGPA
ncbi:helix-turn-helix domain-containing protein [Actinoplanes sp. NPDC024001]|uniref:helix-turn-helix domain-containing protein n=1 Tax=Actinoplanes sp. NPDC024001 TaxID=3154598 RepID=UPI00340B5731